MFNNIGSNTVAERCGRLISPNSSNNKHIVYNYIIIILQ